MKNPSRKVIPAPAWLRKIMAASAKQRSTPEEALLQTQNGLKHRMQRLSGEPGKS